MATTRKLLSNQGLHRLAVYRKKRTTKADGDPVQELEYLCTVGCTATPTDLREYDDGTQVRYGVRWELRTWNSPPMTEVTPDFVVVLDDKNKIELEAVVQEGLQLRLIGVER